MLCIPRLNRCGIFQFIMNEPGTYEWAPKAESKKEIFEDVGNLILNLYLPADEFNYDVHISSRQLISLLSEHFNLSDFNENDLVKVLQLHGFICVELTGPLEFEWLLKKRKKQPLSFPTLDH